ncbi:MAG: hypothetical protein LBS60_02140 [Deltaproteobacteria bacterium]|jgi:hypothetical protein|nr:hypothetical protein [Deltaproteobacteria bacterium]
MNSPNFARHLVSGRLEEIRQKGQPPKAVVQVRLATNPLKDWNSYDVTLRGLLAQTFNQAGFNLGDQVTMLLSNLKAPANPDPLDHRPRALVAKGLDFYDPLSETDPPIDHLTQPD